MKLNEMTSQDILARSKARSKLNRYKSRLDVKNVKLNRVGILEIIKMDQPHLDIWFKVNDTYNVVIRLQDFMNQLRMYYNRNYDIIKSEGGLTASKAMRDCARMAFRDSFQKQDMSISCSCPDAQFRFSYAATLNGYQFSEKRQDTPALRTNPKNMGGYCKHVIKILTTSSHWSEKVVTGILNIIRQDPKMIEIALLGVFDI